MNKNTKHNSQLILVSLFFAITCLVFGKDTNIASHSIKIVIPKIALLDIESVSAKDITLKMVPPSEPGNSLVDAMDKSIWLNVTSVAESGSLRDITVKLDKPMKGIDLLVVSDVYSGSGYGKWGVPLSEITISPNDQTLINGIKSGVTGDGAFNGFNLKYSAQIVDSDYENLHSSTGGDITVTYTITH